MDPMHGYNDWTHEKCIKQNDLYVYHNCKIK